MSISGGIDPEFMRRIAANIRTVQSLESGSVFRSMESVRAALSGLEPMLSSRAKIIQLASIAGPELTASLRAPFLQSLAAATSFESLRPSLQLPAFQMPKAYKAIATMMRQLSSPLKGLDMSRFGQVAQQLGEFAERGRDLDERTDAFLRRHGWPLPISLPRSMYREVVASVDDSRADVNRMMTELFAPGTEGFRFLADGILASSLFATRRPLLRQSFFAAGRKHWYVVINGLLPLVEGALYDAAYETPSARPTRVKPTAAFILLKSDEEQAWATYMVFTRTMEALVLSGGAGVCLYDGFDPTSYGAAGEPRNLNRHAIAHGLARRYGSRRNTLKLVLLIAVLADCLDPVYRRRVGLADA